MSEQYFSGIRVGDKIWTIQEGWTVVELIVPEDVCSIKTTKESFTINGRFAPYDKHQSAFWSDPQIIPPPRPKRMKKVTVEVRPYISNQSHAVRLYPNDSKPLEVVNFCGPVQTIEVEIEDD